MVDPGAGRANLVASLCAQRLIKGAPMFFDAPFVQGYRSNVRFRVACSTDGPTSQG